MRRGAEVLFEDLFRVRWHYRALNGDFGDSERAHTLQADQALSTAAGMYSLDKEIKVIKPTIEPKIWGILYCRSTCF